MNGCGPTDHIWTREYYGYRCAACEEFIPYGCEPWMPDELEDWERAPFEEDDHD